MLGKSARYYRKNKAARDKKKQYDTELNDRPEQIKKRVQANRARRRAKRSGRNVDGMDYDHGSRRFISSSANRGKKSGTKGDSNARG